MNDITVERLEELVDNKNINELRNIFEEYNSVDLSEVVSSLEVKKTVFIFKTVPSNLKAEVFSYLDADYKEELVNFLTGKDIKNIVEELFSDDIVDFIEEMPSNVVKKVLKNIDKELLNIFTIYYESGLNICSTARLLYLHRNTLNYKLTKLSNDLDMDVRDSLIANFIYLLVKII